MFLFVQLKDKILSFRLHHLILILLLSLATCAWGLTLSNQLLNYISQKYGDAAEKRMQHWQQLMSSNKKLTTQQKLDEVNRFFNQVTFLSDLQHWGKIDYWATPIELLVTNGGDCEDYSIAKYFTLREMGIPDNKMRITYVKALKLNQAHMVLAYYEHPEDEPLILDNLINKIKPASKRPDLYPIYSFNADGLWLSKQAGQGKRIGQSGKLSRWVKLNKRLITELNMGK